MKNFKPTLLAILLLFIVASCSKDPIIDNEEYYNIDLTLAQQNDAKFANSVLTLINNHRNSIGLEPLISGSTFSSAYAVDHTNYMIEVNQINHHHFGIRSAALLSRGAQQVGENVAFGYNTAEAVVNAWLNSTSHRDNIEGNYTHAGFGIKKCEDRNTYYFTQLFYKI